MNLLSVKKILEKEIIQINDEPIKNIKTLKEILSSLGLKSVKRGNRIYYLEDELYEALGLKVEETEEE